MEPTGKKLLNVAALTTLFLILGASFASATTYYVSSSQGNDANLGTSPDTPWRSLTNVYHNQWKFQPGDSLLLRAGETFDGPLSMGRAGTAAAPITVDRYGVGANPVIYGDHPTATWSPVGGFPGIYATPPLGRPGPINVGKVYDIDGIKYWHLLRGTSPLTTWLETFTNGCWGASTDGTIIYIRTTDDSAPPQMRLMEACTVNVPAHYIVRNLEVCYGGKGIQTSGEGSKIHNNYIHDAYGVAIGLFNAWNAEVASNRVVRTAYTQIYLQNGGNNWVHHNTCAYTGTDRTNTGTIIAANCFVPNVENCNIGIQQGTNNVVEYNDLSNSQGDFIDWFYEAASIVRYNSGFVSGMATAPFGNGIKMYNNIFNMAKRGSGISAAHGYDPQYCILPDQGTNWIFNNIVYDFVISGFYTRDYSPKVQFRNNILVAGFAGKNLVNISPGTGSDYNVFWCNVGTPLGWVLGDTNVSSSLDVWRQRSGQDGNSIYADPLFVAPNPVTAADFQLQRGSPCIDVAQDLRAAGVRPSGCQDYLGRTIPQGLIPDIGAFEAAVRAPASNLRLNLSASPP